MPSTIRKPTRSRSKKSPSKSSVSKSGKEFPPISEATSYERYSYCTPQDPVPSESALADSLNDVLTIPNKNPNEFLVFQSKLGQGGGGIVYKVLDSRDCVVKAVKVAHSLDLDELKAEIAIHSITQHANIVHLNESFQFEDSIFILMELCDYGSLFDLIESASQKFPENVIAYVIHEILCALAFMHRRHLIHRDVKSDNIFLSKSGNVKLADFGWAIGLTKEKSLRTEAVGTPHWMAPELILEKKYDGKVDVWSTAVTAVEMAEGQPPFMSNTHARAQLFIVLQEAPNISGLKMPYERSEPFNDFLKHSFHKDPKERHSAEQLVREDPFLKDKTERKDFATFIKNAKKEV